jgi:hypothetical protein
MARLYPAVGYAEGMSDIASCVLMQVSRGGYASWENEAKRMKDRAAGAGAGCAAGAGAGCAASVGLDESEEEEDQCMMAAVGVMHRLFRSSTDSTDTGRYSPTEQSMEQQSMEQQSMEQQSMEQQSMEQQSMELGRFFMSVDGAMQSMQATRGLVMYQYRELIHDDHVLQPLLRHCSKLSTETNGGGGRGGGGGGSGGRGGGGGGGGGG